MIAQLAQQLSEGTITATELAELCLSVIDERDDHLRCFLEVDRVAVLAQGGDSDRRRERGERLGPLDGVPQEAPAEVRAPPWRQA